MRLTKNRKRNIRKKLIRPLLDRVSNSDRKRYTLFSSLLKYYFILNKKEFNYLLRSLERKICLKSSILENMFFSYLRELNKYGQCSIEGQKVVKKSYIHRMKRSKNH